jgi:ABC-2 type transport system permease protein
VSAAPTEARVVHAHTATMARTQFVAEQKMFWRNPMSAGFTIVFPIMFLVIFSTLNGGERLGPELGNILFTEYYVPGIVTFAVIAACFTNLSINLTRRRDDGVLKRKRATPLPMVALLGGIVGSTIVISWLMSILTTAVGVVGYHNAAPRHLLWVVVVLALGAFAFSALGLAVTIIIPNADAAPAIVNLLVFPLLFLAGTFFPVQSDTINTISDWFPIRPMQQALLAAFDPVGTGSTPSGHDLFVLAAWGLIGTVVAVRWFRWENRIA